MTRSRLIIALGAVAILVATVAILVVIVPVGHRAPQPEPTEPTPTEATPAAAPRISGYIHTSGTAIYDQAGHKVRLLGIDTEGFIAGPATAACPASTWSGISSSEIASEANWGFNEVRIGITWANLEPTPPSAGIHHWNTAYVSALAAAVRAYNHAGMAVILDFHEVDWSPAYNRTNSSVKSCQGDGAPTWLYPNAGQLPIAQATCDFDNNVSQPGVTEKPQDGLAAAEQYLAGYFGPGSEATHGQVIAFDMLNEPKPLGSTSCAGHVGADMLAVYHKVGYAIRSVDPSAALIYEDYAFESYYSTGFMLSTPLTMSNVIYSAHAYPATWDEQVPATCTGGKAGQGLSFFNAHLQQSVKFNQPLWIGELNDFGTSSSCSDPYRQNDAAAEMVFCTEHDISWSFWSYQSLVRHPEIVPYLQAGFGK